MKIRPAAVESLFALFLGIVLMIPVAVSAHEWMAPKDAAEMTNPIATEASSIAQGKELFQNNCAYCHGQNGSGMSAAQAGLEKSPPNLPNRLENHSDGDFFWKISNGKEEMPAFKDVLKEEEIWHIINFIKSRK